MEFIIELITELVIDGSFELSKNIKTPKWLRYPLIILVALFFIAVIGIIFTLGLVVLKETAIIGTLIIIIAIAFAVYSIAKFIDIYIKRNPNSDEYKLWNKFIEEICTKDLDKLNEEQKNAALCFYYDREMNIGGHVCYFDQYQKVKNKDMITALDEVSNRKFVTNFEEAIATGKEDNYEKTDTIYLRQSPCLTEYLEQYIITNKDKIFEEIEEKF
jgi:hypothetical protein